MLENIAKSVFQLGESCRRGRPTAPILSARTGLLLAEAPGVVKVVEWGHLIVVALSVVDRSVNWKFG